MKDPGLPLSLRINRYATLVLGGAVIVIEVWRRWGQFGDLAMWPAIFDDFLAGGLLIASSWVAARDAVAGTKWLAAAWVWRAE
jgi:hypothetical protein